VTVVDLDAAYELHPQVSLRPERFGALAYHFGNRRLTFLKHPDVLSVVQALSGHESLRSTLTACEVEANRWPAFTNALSTLAASDLIRERSIAANGD
jgi:putative mycofactocin binding protein MftB